MEYQLNPLKASGIKKTEDYNNFSYGDKEFSVDNINRVMHRNLIYDTSSSPLWFERFSRFGWINPFETDYAFREYLFFTKPDLYIFDDESGNRLNESLNVIPFFKDAFLKNNLALRELQYGVKNLQGRRDPFMHLLSNYVTSKMDLPGIGADSNKSTQNVYGVGIDYRSSSAKSDAAFDFSLSFKDTPTLDIYTMVKAYDEYVRLNKMGEINFRSGSLSERYKNYFLANIISDQFSVYKFIVSNDGETIVYYAKATGVYFTDVPRSDFGDPGNDGYKFSLSFHANFVNDMDPAILAEFDALTLATTDLSKFLDVYDTAKGIKDRDNDTGINAEPARYARVIRVVNDKRAERRYRSHTYSGQFSDYRLKWTDEADRNKQGIFI